jgi:uncharacterized protein YrrD
MLILSKSLLNQPVMSLRSGGRVATTLAPIINPNNLKIEGFYCQDKFSKDTLILLSSEVRDIIDQGIVVNDHDALSTPDEIIRLKDMMELGFDVMGKPVVTVTKEKLGKVNDYAADNQTLYIQKLYVGQSLLKSLSGGQLSVDRTNIIEITNRKIVIQEILRPTKAGIPVTASPTA